MMNQGHKVIDPGVIWKGSLVEYIHSAYEVSIFYGSKLMSKVKGFFLATYKQTHTGRKARRQTGQN